MAYIDFTLQDATKSHYIRYRCNLHMLERKCSTGVEKLKDLIGEHLQNGIHASDLLEKIVSFFTLRKTLLLHNGYSKCSRDILRLFPTSDEDVEPLYQEECKDFHELFTSGLDY